MGYYPKGYEYTAWRLEQKLLESCTTITTKNQNIYTYKIICDEKPIGDDRYGIYYDKI